MLVMISFYYILYWKIFSVSSECSISLLFWSLKSYVKLLFRRLLVRQAIYWKMGEKIFKSEYVKQGSGCLHKFLKFITKWISENFFRIQGFSFESFHTSFLNTILVWLTKFSVCEKVYKWHESEYWTELN